jgi:hypothetical protein
LINPNLPARYEQSWLSLNSRDDNAVCAAMIAQAQHDSLGDWSDFGSVSGRS